MIQRIVFGSGTWERAKASLDAGALRQKAIASNIANAATPGYRAKKVVFEEMLSAETSRLPMDRRNERHIGSSGGSSAASTPAPQVRLRGGDPTAGGVNNVSIEAELTELTKNTVHFQSVAQLLANRYKGVRDAIRPGA